MKLLFLTNVPSPYRIDFFEELGKYVDLTVLFEKGTSDERDESWSKYKFTNFTGIVLQGKSTGVDQAYCPSVKQHLKKGIYDEIFVLNATTPTGMSAIFYMKRHKIPYVIENDGAFPGSGKGPKEWLKKQIYKGAKAYFSTCKNNDAYLKLYGAAEGKIYRYPFTTVWDRDVLVEPVSVEEKDSIRKELGINEKNILLAIGQFIPRKGFDILMEVAQELPEDVGIYFVGGEPTAEYLKMKNDRIHFVGFKQKDALAKYYKAADIFVHPTREDIWGLVVNEALAYGLPVVTTDRCNAGLEMLDSNIGFVVPVEDVDALKDSICEMLTDMNLQAAGEQENSRKQCLAKAREYTIETMVKAHLNYMECNL